MKTYKVISIWLLLLFPLGLIASNTGNCKASFIWKQTAGNIISFANNSTPSNGISLWSFGDATGGWSTNPVHAYASPGKYPVCLSFTSVDSTCSSYFCDTIIVRKINADCKAAFVWKKTGINTISFINSSTGIMKSTTYFWDFGDNTTSTEGNPVHKFKDGNYNVCLTIKDELTKCFSLFCATVKVGDGSTACKADFSWKKSDNTFYFHSTSTGVTPTTNYYWYFGDGSTDSSASPIRTYAKPGTYEVCLKIGDKSNNCNSSFCGKIYIDDSTAYCKADFSWKQTATNVISFTNNSKGTSNTTNYLWYLGDGETSLLQNPTHKYAKPGNYRVSLTIKGPHTQCEDSTYYYIHINDSSTVCKASFNWKETPDHTVYFTNTSIGATAATKYYWDFGDGTIDFSASPKHRLTKPGDYKVCLKISDPLTSCNSSYCEHILINDTLNCIANFIPKEISANVISFKNTSSNIGSATSYLWTFGDNTTSSDKDPVHSYAASGNYSVCLNTYDSLNKCYGQICSYITVTGITPVCKASFSWKKNPDNTINFINMSTGITAATNYRWDFGDGSRDTLSASPTHRFTKPGTYDVCLHIYTPLTTCGEWFCDKVVITDTILNCKADFVWMASSPKLVYFINTSPGKTSATKYYWNFGDGNIDSTNSPQHLYANAGTYVACLKIVNLATSCSSSICSTVIINDSIAHCWANFSWSKTATNTITFKNNSKSVSNKTRYFWNFGDGKTSLAENPVYKYAAPGTYRIELSMRDSLTGCLDSTYNYIHVNDTSSACKASFLLYQDPLNKNNYYLVNTSTGTGELSYTWSWSDGTSDTTLYPVHTFTDPGRYFISLAIKDKKTGCTSSMYDSIWSATAPITIRVIPAKSSISENSILNQLSIYPNPVNNSATISYTLTQTATVKIRIYDLLGQQTAELTNTVESFGKHELNWNTSGLPQGIYFIAVTINDVQVTTQRVSVIR